MLFSGILYRVRESVGAAASTGSQLVGPEAASTHLGHQGVLGANPMGSNTDWGPTTAPRVYMGLGSCEVTWKKKIGLVSDRNSDLRSKVVSGIDM